MYSFIQTYICRCLYLYQLQIYYINNNNNHNNSNNITIIISLKSIYQAQKYYNNNGFKRASDWWTTKETFVKLLSIVWHSSSSYHLTYRAIGERLELFDENVFDHFWVTDHKARFAGKHWQDENVAIFLVILVKLKVELSLVPDEVVKMSDERKWSWSSVVASF